MNIQESNKLIAEFMGYKYYLDKLLFTGYTYESEIFSKNPIFTNNCIDSLDIININKDCIIDPDYNEDYNTLMEVVEKIESIYSDFHGYFTVYISGNSCTIQGSKLDTRPENSVYAYFNDSYAKTKIEAIYIACVRFIKWYNINKNTL